MNLNLKSIGLAVLNLITVIKGVDPVVRGISLTKTYWNPASNEIANLVLITLVLPNLLLLGAILSLSCKKSVAKYVSIASALSFSWSIFICRNSLIKEISLTSITSQEVFRHIVGLILSLIILKLALKSKE